MGSWALSFIEVCLMGVFLRAAIWHVRKRQYLQMIGWLLFSQVLVQALDLAEGVWFEIFRRTH